SLSDVDSGQVVHRLEEAHEVVVRGVDGVRACPAAVAEVVSAGVGVSGASGAGRLEAIGRTVIAHPIAVLRHVALTDRRPTHCRALGIGRAVIAHPIAALGQVADTGRGTTHRARMACRVLAGIMCAITLIERASLAIRCTGRAQRLLGIGWARGARPITLLGWITLPCRGPALRACMARRMGARPTSALVGRAHIALIRTGRALGHRVRLAGPTASAGPVILTRTGTATY